MSRMTGEVSQVEIALMELIARAKALEEKARQVEIALVELIARVKALEEKTQSYSWFLRVLLASLVASVLGLLAIHLTWK